MQCRFCLETDTERFIAPCHCNGSVRYIHIECLRRWVIEDGVVQMDRLLCSICNAPLFNLEVVPVRSGLVSFVLFNPIAISILIQYFFLVYSIHSNQRPFTKFREAQECIHYLYMTLYLLYARVKYIHLYREAVIQRKSYIYPILHAYCLCSFLQHENVFMAFACNFILTIYWHEHAILLNKVNEMIVKN